MGILRAHTGAIGCILLNLGVWRNHPHEQFKILIVCRSNAYTCTYMYSIHV